MKAKNPQFINGKVVTPEDQYRRKLRITARLLDYDVDLKNMGYGEEMLLEIRKNPVNAMALNRKFSAIYDGFTLKPTGYEQELLRLFAKYDDLMKTCKSDQERKAIATMGIMDISKLLDDGEFNPGVGGSLIIDGTTVLKK